MTSLTLTFPPKIVHRGTPDASQVIRLHKRTLAEVDTLFQEQAACMVVFPGALSLLFLLRH